MTDPYSVTAAGSITNSSDAPVLGRPWGIATFTSGGSAYAAVAASDSNGVQILDVTDPSSITAAGSITDVSSPALGGAQAIAIFNSTGGTYAAVAAFNDDGVQIIHLAGNNVPTVDAGPDQTVSEGDPVSLPWSASDEDGDALMYAWSQSPADPAITLISPDLPPTTFTAPPVDSKTVIALTLTVSDGIARSSDTLRVTITDPSDIPLTAAGSIIDTDALRLKGASGVAVFASGGRTYAAVAAFNEGVQILDVTDPYSVTAAGSIADDDAPELRGAGGIATFESGGGTYAAVAASTDSGVQILDVTDPYSVTAAGSINNTGALELDGPQGIAIFESGGGTYAAVAAHVDDSIQILDVSNPYSVTAAGSINNTDALELSGPAGIAIFESGGSTYAAVAALEDDGVQILNITDPSSITAAGSITNTDDLKLDGARGIAVFCIRQQHLRGGRRKCGQRRPDTQHNRPVQYHRRRQHHQHRRPQAASPTRHRRICIRQQHLRGSHRIPRRRHPDTRRDRPVQYHRRRQDRRQQRPRAARRMGHRHIHIRRQHLRGSRRIRRRRRPDHTPDRRRPTGCPQQPPDGRRRP